MTRQDLERRFPVKGDELTKTVIRLYYNLALRLDVLLESSREKTIAIEKLEESLLWALKHIDTLEISEYEDY